MDEQFVNDIGESAVGSGASHSRIIGDVVVELLPMPKISKGLCRENYDPWVVRTRHNCPSTSVISSEIFDPDQYKVASSRYKALMEYHTTRWSDFQEGRIPETSKYKKQKTS